MDIQVRRNNYLKNLGEIIINEGPDLEVWQLAINMGPVLSYCHCEILNPLK
jgi:hypothetical protein